MVPSSLSTIIASPGCWNPECGDVHTSCTIPCFSSKCHFYPAWLVFGGSRPFSREGARIHKSIAKTRYLQSWPKGRPRETQGNPTQQKRLKRTFMGIMGASRCQKVCVCEDGLGCSLFGILEILPNATEMSTTCALNTQTNLLRNTNKQ